MTELAKREWPPIWHIVVVLCCLAYIVMTLRNAITALSGDDWGLAASLAFSALGLGFIYRFVVPNRARDMDWTHIR